VKIAPELETLDQLLGGELSLAVIRALYPDAQAFMKGILGLLTCGDVNLFTPNRDCVPAWRWRELFIDGIVMSELESLTLRITEQGTHRIA
jgi:hypothetical protein